MLNTFLTLGVAFMGRSNVSKKSVTFQDCCRNLIISDRVVLVGEQAPTKPKGQAHAHPE